MASERETWELPGPAVKGFLEMFTTSFVIVSVEYLAVKHSNSSEFQSLSGNSPEPAPCPIVYLVAGPPALILLVIQ